jgi:predicted DNA-binding transcriptional regulator AlpA
MQQVQKVVHYPVRLRRKREVCEMTSLPASTLDDYVRQGLFPQPQYLGSANSKKSRIPVWKESTIIEWMESLPCQ